MHRRCPQPVYWPTLVYRRRMCRRIEACCRSIFEVSSESGGSQGFEPEKAVHDPRRRSRWGSCDGSLTILSAGFRSHTIAVVYDQFARLFPALLDMVNLGSRPIDTNPYAFEGSVGHGHIPFMPRLGMNPMSPIRTVMKPLLLCDYRRQWTHSSEYIFP